MISRSKSGPRISAALRVSQNSVFTPVEKFEAQTMGICACLQPDFERVGVRVAGGADDQRLFVLRAKIRNPGRGRVRAEIHHHVAFGNDGAQIVAGVNLAGDFNFAKVRRAGDERLAHAAFRTGDDDFCHR